MQNVYVVKCRLFFMLRRSALSSYLFVKLWLHLQLIYLYMYNSTLGNEQKSPLFSFLLAGKERPLNGMWGNHRQSWILSRCGFKFPGTRIHIPCQWNLDSSIPIVHGIPDSTSKNFPYSGIRITWHRANHTDSWLKLHMRSHIPSPYIRCSTRVPKNFPFRPTQKTAVYKKCS